MDFSKLLQHCRDEHRVELDTTKFTEELLWAIFKYFGDYHEKTLLHTEQWDVLEQLQKVTEPITPPPIIAEIKRRAIENIRMGERMEHANWSNQEGVLLNNADALKIVEFCEQVATVFQDAAKTRQQRREKEEI